METPDEPGSSTSLVLKCLETTGIDVALNLFRTTKKNAHRVTWTGGVLVVEAIHALLENDALLVTVCISVVAVIVMGIDLFKERQARKAMDQRIHTYVDNYLDTLSFPPLKK